MTDELDDVLNEFIIESSEGLDHLDRELVTLEREATPDALASIFRDIHTIKGTSGFFGFGKLEAVAHVGENLLSRMRDGQIEVNQTITTALLAMVDALRETIDHIASDGTEGAGNYDELVAELERLDRENGAPAAAAAPVVAPEPDADSADAEPAVDAEPIADAGTEPVAEPVAEPAAEPVVDTAAVAPTPAADVADVAVQTPDPTDAAEAPEPASADAAVPAAAPVPDAAVAPAVASTPAPTAEPVVESAPASQPAVAAADLAEGVAETAPAEQSGVPATQSHVSDTIRVDVGLLDDLMNLVGELVLARNQILQFTEEQADAVFSATTQRLDLITTELQEGVMRTRMQPIENIWNKFPRVVRDLSLACDKQAELVMEGKHTELDKTLLEAIKDPLTHLVRNSVDHGLETPAERVANGKPPAGTVRLRAYHEGGQVIIEISDDGAGINPAAIRRKAVEKGMLTTEEANARSDREVVNLVFQPGFSTAAAVTNISGRGVGMDVVRTNIEAIGGSVDIQSVSGSGTTVKVKIPLTLAIIPALVVACDGDRFAIPQVSLLELVRIDGHDPQTSIELVHGVPVYRLRGRLLPLVYLHEVFGKEAPDSSDGINIVVLEADDREFGLVVDEISDTAEIVVKPLGRLLKQVSAFAGATIMGDGRVALILDVLGISEQIGMSSSSDGRQLANAPESEAAEEVDARRLLMLRIGDRRIALPLDTVARLEEFDVDQLEKAGGGRVVQYRGEIMHLVDVAKELGIPPVRPPDQPLQVVVYMAAGRSVGVVVDAITDVVEEAIDVKNESMTRGIVGSAVIQGRVTDILDVDAVLRSALPALFTTEAA